MLAEIKGSFKLLAREVLQSASETRDLLRKRDPAKSRDLYNRSAYIATHVALLQKQIMELFLGKVSGYKESFYLHGLSSISSRLERISDIFLNLDQQAGYLRDPDFLKRFRLDDFFHDILHGLGKIHPAIENRDVSLAVRLGHAEERLDASYADRFAKIVAELKEGGGRADDLVTTLMIVHYLERAGDMLLEIGEKIIFIIMGEKIKLEQYKALGAGLKAAGQNMELGRMGYKSIWGGRSGCRIGVVGKTEEGGGEGSSGETVLFKHGPAQKLNLEKDNLVLWQSLRPGLTPLVKAYIPARALSEAALMLEYIPARNLQSIFMENAPEAAFKGLENALSVMAGLWLETKKDAPSAAEFARQADNRLGEARSMYPNLIKFHGSIGAMEILPLQKLLAVSKEEEKKTPSPFTMLIHGDFNLSNILYDTQNDRAFMVDLYRSARSDYVQDVSVLIVSILRLPVIEPIFRKKLAEAAFLAYDFALGFAKDLGDATYEARLAHGLARSFLTSTRFLLEEKLAAVFVARARYIYEKLHIFQESGRPAEEFALPREVLRFQIS